MDYLVAVIGSTLIALGLLWACLLTSRARWQAFRLPLHLFPMVDASTQRRRSRDGEAQALMGLDWDNQPSLNLVRP